MRFCCKNLVAIKQACLCQVALGSYIRSANQTFQPKLVKVAYKITAKIRLEWIIAIAENDLSSKMFQVMLKFLFNSFIRGVEFIIFYIFAV